MPSLGIQQSIYQVPDMKVRSIRWAILGIILVCSIILNYLHITAGTAFPSVHAICPLGGLENLQTWLSGDSGCSSDPPSVRFVEYHKIRSSRVNTKSAQIIKTEICMGNLEQPMGRDKLSQFFCRYPHMKRWPEIQVLLVAFKNCQPSISF